jgi:NADPH:quinone reductase-like Zn-dependent oxidoreductase
VRYTRIVVTHYGGPEELRVVKEECPEPKRDEVRLRVLTAGVCLPDVMMREGIHPETPALPFTPGWDLVGVVDRLGEGASDRNGPNSWPPRRSVARTRSSSAWRNVNCFQCRPVWISPRLSVLC